MAELLAERLSDLQAQISTQDARDRSAVEAERNRASTELSNVKRALDDSEAATRAALSELERRLARNLAESTASILINTEKLAKRHDRLSSGLEGETKQRQEETAAFRADLDATTASLAKHSNEILLEGRHAFAACEERISNVERVLREKEETDLSHLENAIDRNQVRGMQVVSAVHILRPSTGAFQCLSAPPSLPLFSRMHESFFAITYCTQCENPTTTTTMLRTNMYINGYVTRTISFLELCA